MKKIKKVKDLTENKNSAEKTKPDKKISETTKLNTLVMMQLKNKIDFSFLKDKKKAFLKISLLLLAFVALTASIYLLFFLASVFRLFSFGTRVPVNVLVVIFTVMMILSIITCTFGLMKSLYFSQDNQVLLTFPISRTKIFISKLIVFYINEIIKSISFILPIFIAFGLVNALPFYYFIWLVACLFIVAMVPVAIGALLSIPVMAIIMIIRKNRSVEIATIAVFIAFLVWGIVHLINAIPADINIVGSWGTLFWDIQDFLTAFSNIFYPFTCLTHMIVGKVVNITAIVFSVDTVIYLVSFLAGIAVVFGLSFLLARPLFFKMASKPFEYRKKDIKVEKKNHKASSFWSGVKKEGLVILRNSNKLYSLLFIALGLPITILFLNKIFSAMSMRLSGTYMTIAFNILIMLLIALASNSPMAKVFSEDGNSHYIYKTIPQKYCLSLLPKIIINYVVMTLSIIASVLVFQSFAKLSVFNMLLLMLALLFIYTAHLFWSAEFDIMNPLYDQFQSSGVVINNPNENKSIIATFVIAFITCGIAYFLMQENSNTVYYKILIFATIFLVYRTFMFFDKVRLYYQDPYKGGNK